MTGSEGPCSGEPAAQAPTDLGISAAEPGHMRHPSVSACSSPTSNPLTTPTLTAGTAGQGFTATTSAGMPTSSSVQAPAPEQADHSTAAASRAGEEAAAPAAAEPTTTTEDSRQPVNSTAPGGARSHVGPRMPTPLPAGDATPDNWATFGSCADANIQVAAQHPERASCAEGDLSTSLDLWRDAVPLASFGFSQPAAQQERQPQSALPAGNSGPREASAQLPLQVWNRSSTTDAMAGQKPAAAGRVSRAGSLRTFARRSSLLPPVLPKYRGSPLRVPAQPGRTPGTDAAAAEGHPMPAHAQAGDGEQAATFGTAAEQSGSVRVPPQPHSSMQGRLSAMPRLPPRPRMRAQDQASSAARDSAAALSAQPAALDPGASASQATAGDRAYAVGSVAKFGSGGGAELRSPFSPDMGALLEGLPTPQAALPDWADEGTAVADSQPPHTGHAGMALLPNTTCFEICSTTFHMCLRHLAKHPGHLSWCSPEVVVPAHAGSNGQAAAPVAPAGLHCCGAPAHGAAAQPSQAPGGASPARPRPPPAPQRLQSPQLKQRPAKEIPSYPVDISSGSSEAFDSELGPLGRSLDAAAASLLRQACQVSAQPLHLPMKILV